MWRAQGGIGWASAVGGVGNTDNLAHLTVGRNSLIPENGVNIATLVVVRNSRIKHHKFSGKSLARCKFAFHLRKRIGISVTGGCVGRLRVVER
jgi:hypothetical protein